MSPLLKKLPEASTKLSAVISSSSSKRVLIQRTWFPSNVALNALSPLIIKPPRDSNLRRN